MPVTYVVASHASRINSIQVALYLREFCASIYGVLFQGGLGQRDGWLAALNLEMWEVGWGWMAGSKLHFTVGSCGCLQSLWCHLQLWLLRLWWRLFATVAVGDCGGDSVALGSHGGEYNVVAVSGCGGPLRQCRWEVSGWSSPRGGIGSLEPMLAENTETGCSKCFVLSMCGAGSLESVPVVGSIGLILAESRETGVQLILVLKAWRTFVFVCPCMIEKHGDHACREHGDSCAPARVHVYVCV
eukprot:26143-Pelagomonas_calceolata.AAC.4